MRYLYDVGGIFGGGPPTKPKVDPEAEAEAEAAAKAAAEKENRKDLAGATGTRTSLLTPLTSAANIDSARKTLLGSP